MESLYLLPILAQSEGGGGAIAAIIGLFSFVIIMGVAAIMIASMWKVFTKAGHPGWAAIVPIYNIFIMVQIAQKETWWIVLFFIPFANLIAAIIINIEIAKAFGKGTGFGLGLVFFPIICYPMLGFGSATYQGGTQSALAV